MNKEEISWLGTPESRILSIRKFRKYIDGITFDQAVKLTQKNWNAGPRLNKLHFDITNIDAWPTPWDLFGQSAFCQNSQILGAFYTLLLSSHALSHTIKLAIVQDIINGEHAVIVLDNYPLTDLTIETIISSEDIKDKLGA